MLGWMVSYLDVIQLGFFYCRIVFKLFEVGIFELWYAGWIYVYSFW